MERHVPSFAWEDFVRTRVAIASVLLFLISISDGAIANSCAGPALWRVGESGTDLIVLREATGRADFQGQGSFQSAVALEVIYTTSEGKTGYGTLWGPMRSYMFMAPNVTSLEEKGFTWELPSQDKAGHYTVRSSDGLTVVFHMTFERCL